MTESRKNSNRKGKQVAYQQQQKSQVSTDDNLVNTPAMRQIIKQPQWSADDSFVLTGQGLAMLMQFIEPYRELIKLSDSIFLTGELEEKISYKYLYDNGTEVSDSDPRKAQLLAQDQNRMKQLRILVEKKQQELADLAQKIPTEENMEKPN